MSFAAKIQLLSEKRKAKSKKFAKRNKIKNTLHSTPTHYNTMNANRIYGCRVGAECFVTQHKQEHLQILHGVNEITTWCKRKYNTPNLQFSHV